MVALGPEDRQRHCLVGLSPLAKKCDLRWDLRRGAWPVYRYRRGPRDGLKQLQRLKDSLWSEIDVQYNIGERWG